MSGGGPAPCVYIKDIYSKLIKTQQFLVTGNYDLMITFYAYYISYYILHSGPLTPATALP